MGRPHDLFWENVHATLKTFSVKEVFQLADVANKNLKNMARLSTPEVSFQANWLICMPKQ